MSGEATPPAGFRSECMAVKDITMHYVIGGSGPPVAIVHGGWDSWWAWREVASALSDRYTVILPALRGLAASSKPESGYDADNLGDDLFQLLRGLGHDRYALVGHDWGAVACYALAAQHPDAVERFAVFDMAIPGVGVLEQAIIPQPGGAYLWHFGFHSVPEIPEMLIEGHLSEYMRWFFSAGAADPHAVGEDSLARYVELYSRPGAIPAFLQYYRNFWIHGEQVKAHMAGPKLPMPVLAFGGAQSVGAGTRACMEALCERVEGGVIPDCGHWVAEEQPAFVLAALSDFLTMRDPVAATGGPAS
jgi:pimeloyl-ACP methyl ester carboxylesterase